MSMQQPFKFRHLDSIVGAFVLTAVAIVIIALALIGSAKQWFVSRTEIEARTLIADKDEAEFYEELAEGLKPGTPIELAGQVVGSVLSSDAKAGVLSLRLYIANWALDQLHQGVAGPGGRLGDAKASIKAPIAAFMGQPRVVLKPGSDGVVGWTTDKWHEHQPLAIVPPRDSTAMAMAVLRDLKANLGPMMQATTGLVTQSRDLVAEIRAQRLPQQVGEFVTGLRERQVAQRLDALLTRIDAIAATSETIASGVKIITDEAQVIASDTRRITSGLAEGKGIAGRALSDAQFGEDLTKLASDLRAITSELRKAAPTAPALAEGAGTLLDEAQRLVDGLNRHWLLKSYTEPGSGERIAPPGIIDAPEAKP